jgi:predicted transcriptional regulator
MSVEKTDSVAASIDASYPENVKEDLMSGFIMTDEDDGFQRCKKLSDSIYHYCCDNDGFVVSEVINVDEIDKADAISGFYDSVQAVHEIYGEHANMIFAECYFENNAF